MDQGRMKDPEAAPAAAAASAAGDIASSDPDTARRTAEIRTEIEQTREEMAETIDAIEDRLRPRNIVASATERVKAAATERMRAMADTAGETAHTMMDRAGVRAHTMMDRGRDTAGGLLEVVRENPYPAALIGIGAAWLLFSTRNNREPDWDSIRGYRRRTLFGRRDWTADAGEREAGFYAGESMDRPGGYAERVSDTAHDMAQRAREYAGDTGESLRRTGRRAQNQFQRMMSDNPLLVGAGALLLGAAFGLAIPESEHENEWMGEARDSMVDRAQELAGDAADKLKDAAGNVASAAGSVADSVKTNRQ